MTNAFTKGATLARRMTEMTGAYDGAALGACSGLVEGTKIATAMGFQHEVSAQKPTREPNVEQEKPWPDAAVL